MAVPDWPGTNGHNMFLFPWQLWIYGPFDLFVEHGHRLLGSLAGMLTIGLVAACVITRRPRWLILLSLGCLVAVIAQGVLGGVRVLLDARLVAMIHGCVGPAFFALCAVTAVVTSRRWHDLSPAQHVVDSGTLVDALLVVALAYIQLVFGALLRHTPVDASPSFFRVAVLFHVANAFVVAFQVGVMAWRMAKIREASTWLTRPTTVLALLTGLQLLLGAGTWVLKYSFPASLDAFKMAAGYTITANSLTQSLVTTAHVAVGSLILAVSSVLLVRVAGSRRGAMAKISFEFRAKGLAL